MASKVVSTLEEEEEDGVDEREKVINGGMRVKEAFPILLKIDSPQNLSLSKEQVIERHNLHSDNLGKMDQLSLKLQPNSSPHNKSQPKYPSLATNLKYPPPPQPRLQLIQPKPQPIPALSTEALAIETSD
ncbi:hypothetical protein CFP56_032892 [Quercus suber]|uniref:Uncharacterized protein n=1 Tax=Quercus suber TaxID=58331 RepID=A0AAW0LRV6_QUESU